MSHGFPGVGNIQLPYLCVFKALVTFPSVTTSSSALVFRLFTAPMTLFVEDNNKLQLSKAATLSFVTRPSASQTSLCIIVRLHPPLCRFHRFSVDSYFPGAWCSLFTPFPFRAFRKRRFLYTQYVFLYNNGAYFSFVRQELHLVELVRASLAPLYERGVNLGPQTMKESLRPSLAAPDNRKKS